MTTKKLITVTAAIFIISGCVKDPIYYTIHPQHGQITVTADWGGIGNDIPVPSGYTVAVGDMDYQSQAATYTIPDLIDPGDYTLYLYNEPSAFTFSGTTAYVVPIGVEDYIEPMPGWLFTGKTDARIEKDRDYEFMVGMTQRVRELTLTINPTGGSVDRMMVIIGTLSGVAGSYDMASDTRGDNKSIQISFTKITSGANAGKWQGTVRLLGITGGVQKLTGIIMYEDGSPANSLIESDLSDALKGFNDDMTKPLVLGGTMVETLTETGMTAVIEDWGTVVIEDGYADMLTLYVTEAGLKAAIESAGIDPLTVGRLRIAGGELTVSDFEYMRGGMPNLTELDMRNATFEDDTIPDSAFEAHTKLRKVILPESVTTISYCAFYQCAALESVTIPGSVTTIGDYAFAECPVLESVDLPKGVTTIGEGLFCRCYALKSVTIPDNVTAIGDYAFYQCYALESVTIPENVTAIGIYAFYQCTALESATIFGNINKIGISAFHKCSALESLVMKNGVGTISKNAFKECSALGSVNIPGSVDTIGNYAFENCTGLKSVVMDEGVVAINYGAFQSCSALESVAMPNSVTEIGSYAFYGCSALGTIKLPANDDFTIINTGTFMNCAGLRSVEIPDNVMFIDANTFNGCASLSSIIIPNSVMEIGEFAFNGCSALTSITIPNSVTAIMTETFAGCSALTSITIPNSVTTIMDNVFFRCHALKSITIPNSVMMIYEGAFTYCTSLKSITLPENDLFITIANSLFFECSALESIIIPKSVSTINDKAFTICTKLTSVTVLATTPPALGDDVFKSVPGLSNISVPDGSVDDYKAADGWSDYADIITAI